MNFLFTLLQYVGICGLLWVAYLMLPKGKISKEVRNKLNYILYVLTTLIMIFGIWQASTVYGYRHELNVTPQQHYVPETTQIDKVEDNLVEQVDRMGTFDDKLNKQ